VDRSVPPTLVDEIASLYANTDAVVAAAGLELADIAKITFSVRDRALRDEINRGRLGMFPDPNDRPTRHVAVAEVPHPLNIQAEVLAYAGHATSGSPDSEAS